MDYTSCIIFVLFLFSERNDQDYLISIRANTDSITVTLNMTNRFYQHKGFEVLASLTNWVPGFEQQENYITENASLRIDNLILFWHYELKVKTRNLPIRYTEFKVFPEPEGTFFHLN